MHFHPNLERPAAEEGLGFHLDHEVVAVAAHYARRLGRAVGFGEFMWVGVPFTAAAVLAASLFVWLLWRS
ncbi:MAG: hypothetical protein V1918_09880 [Planctomycetota bacterium]